MPTTEKPKEKRDLVFLWINEGEDGVFKDQNVNFGSEYVFKVERVGARLKLSAVTDASYIPDFFSAPSQPGSISNLTAFVGKNGTGKTKLCKLIANVVGGQADCEFVSVVRVRAVSGAVWYEAYHSLRGGRKEGHINSLRKFHLGEQGAQPRPEKLDIDSSLESCQLRQELDFGKVVSLYYSPIIDFSNTEFRKSYRGHIDISANNLLITAVESHMDTTEKFDRVDLMNLIRSKDFERQYVFFMSQAGDHVLKSSSKVDLHTDQIWVEAIKLKHDIKNEFHNIPTTFHNSIRKLEKLYDDELRSWQRRLSTLTTESSAAVTKHEQERMVFSYAYYMFVAFLYNLNLDNSHLDGDGHQFPLYGGDSFIEGVRHFFEQQHIVDPTSFVLCIDILQNNVRQIKKAEYSTREIKFTLEQTEMFSLFVNHLNIETELSGIHHKKEELSGYGFMKFEWGIDPSSGEKAFMDLYSRLYYARTMMKDGVGWHQMNAPFEGYPEQLIIVLDEAELGFHPAWQQEFVMNLTAALPWIFSTSRTDKGKGMYGPNWTPVQLVIATHSPVSLSDVPLTHTSFLERVSEEGKYIRKVMRGEELGIKHTFGANIHDLYRNSFFLSKHMVGDFAYQKMDEVVKFLIDPDADPIAAPRMKSTIDLIGEPVIREKLLEMYNARFN